MSVRNNSFINLFLLITLICSAMVIGNEMEMEQQKKLDFSQLLKHIDSRFQPILHAPEQFRFQVIYTMVHRNQSNEPTFETFQFGMKDGTYFYPASAIKFPIAVLALEKLNNISSIDMDTPMKIEDHPIGLLGMKRDETSHSGYPSIAHFIHKLFIVSDNDAFNRLYEFLGRDYINKRLWELGYRSTRIHHRLGIGLSEKQNLVTNQIQFFNQDGILYHQESEIGQLPLDAPFDNYFIGESHRVGNEVIPEPFDFSKKNYMSLKDKHNFLIHTIFPEVFENREINLTERDKNYLYKCMSILPRESHKPVYDREKYFDSYCKFFLFGDNHATIPSSIRLFNKVGLAYGFLIDSAYIVDFDNNVEFFLSAVVYGNENGIINDDTYDYDSLTIPFLSELGRVIYEFELFRDKDYIPDLNRFKLEY
tara:strand:- start:285 stop:1550 length:1266 start_codon:yes stop_codon:yes gene_type:complete